MIARAIALASVLGEDAAPLDALPEPYAGDARRARARLLGGHTGSRAAVIARETVALFACPPPPTARRVLAPGLLTALAADEAVAPGGALPRWLERGIGATESLGLAGLARATVGGDAATTAELLRRLPASEAAALVTASRRERVDAALAARSRTVVAFAGTNDQVSPLTRRVGLYRLALAATIEPGALAALAAALPTSERAAVQEAGESLWFVAGEEAAAERALVEQDLEEPA